MYVRLFFIGMKYALIEFLISFRNYCFNETKNNRDLAYAEGAHLQMFMVILFIYMFSIPASLLLIIFRLLPTTLATFKSNPVFKLAFSVIVLLYFGKIVLGITRHIAETPVDQNWGKEKLRQLRPIYVAFMFLSIVAVFASMALASTLTSYFLQIIN